jgi:hypothetical protein
MSDGRCFADPDRNSVSFHLARGNDLPQIEVGATAVDSGITIQPNLAPLFESSYLCCKTADIKGAHDIDVQWEVLHGEPADAICRYLSGASETFVGDNDMGVAG